MSDRELGAFLRARREAVTPAEVGLPSGGRRRTPGLRRSELATLAGISVEYLTRLEQGRDRHPSAEVLGALSDALLLPADARVHLRILAKGRGLGACCAGVPPTVAVRPSVRALVARLEPAPALLVNRLGDILAWTGGYDRLARPVGLLDGAPPNLTRFHFTDERARTAYPDWEHVADERVAALRAGFASDDPHLRDLVDELTITAGAPFGRRAGGPPRLPNRNGAERFVHPSLGELRLVYETLELPVADDQQLIVYLPGDEATAEALDRREPVRLRAVPG
ncbi:helix-turn-helix domain-containing protein [Spirillospora albida]|uniref:helix-turn-helix domain-containing protein n=1 Tax=Spirillospora albida TaxID=58123 RepID=UPI0004C110A2|nr:helix-turn-helix transcriptional regulator [Spirillospora albida]